MPEYGQLTLGAVVALLILKEVLPALRKQRSVTSIAPSVVHDASDIRTAVDTALLINVLPILKAQTEILADLRGIARKQEERFIGLQYTVDEVKGDTSSTRANIHGLRNDIQRAFPRTPSPELG